MKKKIIVGFIVSVIIFVGNNYYLYGAQINSVGTGNDVVEMMNIGVGLVENDVIISSQTYDESKTGILIKEISNDKFKVGKIYKEELRTKNLGEIDQYIRVTIFKEWLDKNGNVDLNMGGKKLDMIEIIINNEDWIIDNNNSTNAKTTLYYKYPILKGQESSNFMDGFKISSKIGEKVEFKTQEKEGYTIVTSNKKYDGACFRIRISVDAIQTHFAEEGIHSVWGGNIKVNEETGEITLL